MARVTLSGIITDINGSVGGWTFQNSAAGKIVRSKPIQKKMPTSRQVDLQFIPSLARFLWAQLSGSEQADWVSFAGATPFTDIYGNIKTLTGYQFFISSIFRRLFAGTLSDLLAPSGVPAPDAMGAFTVTMDATNLRLQFGGALSYADNHMWIYCTYPTQTPAQTNRRQYRPMTSTNDQGASFIDITADFEAYFDISWNTLYTSSSFYLHVHAFFMRDESGIASTAVFASGNNF
jgi:hypothetical protein